MATNWLRIGVKLAITASMILLLMFACSYPLLSTPKGYRKENILGKSIQQIDGELGPAYSDSRTRASGASAPVVLVYSYGFGQRCLIEFDAEGIAVDVRYYSK